MTQPDPAIDRLRSHLLKGGLKDTVVLREDLAGIVQAVRGPSAEPQRVEKLEAALKAVALNGSDEVPLWSWCDDGWTCEHAECIQGRAALDPSEPLATVPQEAEKPMEVIRCGCPILTTGISHIPGCLLGVRGKGPSLDAAISQHDHGNCALCDQIEEELKDAQAAIHDYARRSSEAQPTLPPAPDPQRGAALEDTVRKGLRDAWTSCVHAATGEGEAPCDECVTICVCQRLAALSAAKAPRGDADYEKAALDEAIDSGRKFLDRAFSAERDLAEARAAIREAAILIGLGAPHDPEFHKHNVVPWLASPAVRAALGKQG